MKAARLVVLGVALAAGGVAALLASGHRDAPPPAAPQPQIATVDVLVAKNDLSRGQVIGDGDIDWQPWPTTSANPNFIRKTDRPDALTQFKGAIVRVPLASGEPVRDPAVVFAKGSGFLAAILPKGSRGVAMEVSAADAAGGFILPDDHVDVILTRHEKAAQGGAASDRVVTDTILRNIRVLAIDQAVEEKAGQKVVVGKTATLELTPDQAEALQLARQQGSLTLSLRSLTDSDDSSDDDSDTTGKKRAPINTVRYGVSTVSTSR